MGPAEPGILLTDATVTVLETLRGVAVPSGQHLTVTQLGGTDPQGRQMLDLEDPLFQAGQEEILFLIQHPDGKYSTLGGPQGRFTVSAANTVHPLDPTDYPYTRSYGGMTVAALGAAVQAVP